ALAILHPHCVVAVAAPAQAPTALCGRQLPCQGAATPATGVVAPVGGKAGRGRQPLAGWSLAAAPLASVSRAAAPCGLAIPVVPAGAAPAGRGLAMGGRPCMGAGRGWLPLLLAAFAAKTQQEHVERFYAIQSHHTQFKTNLSHENIGFDTAVGKPQRGDRISLYSISGWRS
ncbi:hypothetical protein BHM03_00055419, partial [Ensete ventricosum]